MKYLSLLNLLLCHIYLNNCQPLLPLNHIDSLLRLLLHRVPHVHLPPELPILRILNLLFDPDLLYTPDLTLQPHLRDLLPQSSIPQYQLRAIRIHEHILLEPDHIVDALPLPQTVR